MDNMRSSSSLNYTPSCSEQGQPLSMQLPPTQLYTIRIQYKSMSDAHDTAQVRPLAMQLLPPQLQHSFNLVQMFKVHVYKG